MVSGRAQLGPLLHEWATSQVPMCVSRAQASPRLSALPAGVQSPHWATLRAIQLPQAPPGLRGTWRMHMNEVKAGGLHRFGHRH